MHFGDSGAVTVSQQLFPTRCTRAERPAFECVRLCAAYHATLDDAGTAQARALRAAVAHDLTPPQRRRLLAALVMQRAAVELHQAFRVPAEARRGAWEGDVALEAAAGVVLEDAGDLSGSGSQQVLGGEEAWMRAYVADITAARVRGSLRRCVASKSCLCAPAHGSEHAAPCAWQASQLSER